MSALKFKLQFEQGATYDKTFVWKVGAKAATAVPVDLTGCTAHGQVRATVDGEEVLLDMSTENGRIILGGVDGTIRFLVDDETTTAFNWTTGVHDLKIKFANGFVKRRLAGPATVSKGVTRDK